MPNNERYIIVCDESTRHGKNYSYFYGGAILKESDYASVSGILRLYAESRNLGELKRTKITLANYKSYIGLLDLFFTFVKANTIRARVMFSKNDELDIIPSSLDETYCKFYYLFIRHAFSIYYAKKDIQLRLAFDDLPETKESCQNLKEHLVNNLNSIQIVGGNRVLVAAQDIEEVNSKKHPILQCMDVIMGLVDFALNSTVEERKSNRGKARWEVWKYVEDQINTIHYPFNITATTQPLYSNRGWKDPYKHFVYKKKTK